MRVLVIGAGGFVGRHLLSCLRNAYPKGAFVTPSLDELDLLNYEAVETYLEGCSPTHVINLAGIAAPNAAARAARMAWDLHVHAAENLGRQILRKVPDTWLINVGSGLAYGRAALKGRPISEADPMEPTDTYGITKAAGDMAIGALIHKGLRLIRMRPFNHSGAGQTTDFVVPAFADQIARIEVRKQAPVINVGNLFAARDFLHVSDVAQAYLKVIEATFGTAPALSPGAVFNVASGKGTKIRYVLDRLLSESRVDIEVRDDPERQRPSDLKELIGDASSLRDHTGWEPRFTLDDALNDVLAERRAIYNA